MVNQNLISYTLYNVKIIDKVIILIKRSIIKNIIKYKRKISFA